MSMYPPPLQKGDTIGVMATSCWLDYDDLLPSKNHLESLGYRVFIHEQTTNRHYQSAGTAEEKVDAFHDLIRNPDIKAIIGARGGNRAATMLDKLDFNLIQSNPKIVMGYSDVTTLLNAIYQKCDLVGFHGPLFRELAGHRDFDQAFRVLSGDRRDLRFENCNIIQSGTVKGHLIGGNLSLFQTLIGTPYAPDMDGAILFLEDVGDHVSRYDRMLLHLKNAGILDKIAGLIIGRFSNMQDTKENPFGFSLQDCVEEHMRGTTCPIIMKAPFGHDGSLPTFPVGASITMETEGKALTLKWT